MLTDYHHVDSQILLQAFLTPESEGDEVSLCLKVNLELNYFTYCINPFSKKNF
jgi:hypothetical protein